MGSSRHMAGDTAGGSFRILGQLVDDAVEGGFVHFLVGVVRAEMATAAGLWVPGLCQGKPMGGMAAVTSFLDDVATLAIGRPDFLRDAQIFPVGPHPLPAHGVAALFKLLNLLTMAFSALFRKDHGFLFRGCLMVDMTGHAVDAVLGMLRFHPGLEKPRRYSLVTFHAKSRVHFGVGRFREKACTESP